ncbi:ABC transporter permease [bacterium]|nr:ABC transporter permease [bacterium]
MNTQQSNNLNGNVKDCPPKISEWLARQFTYVHSIETYLGDLSEEYTDQVDQKGSIGARRWYRRQVLRACIPAIYFYLNWRVTMFKNGLLVAWRQLRRHSIFSLLNLSGLTIGLAAFLLIALYVQHEISYDRHHENGDRIVRVGQEMHGHFHGSQNKMLPTPAPLVHEMISTFPEVENGTRIVRKNEIRMKIGDREWFQDEVFAVDPAFYEIFTYDFVQGDAESALAGPQGLIITESMKKRLFGETEAIGRNIQLESEVDFTVKAVMKDMPRTGHFRSDILMSMEGYARLYNVDITQWRGSGCFSYLLLKKEADLRAIEEQMLPIAEQHVNNEHLKRSFFLQPLHSIHLHSHLLYEIMANGDARQVQLFALIGIALLALACMNYTNLILAQSARRLKEMGVRKVVGADRKDLIRQLLAEALGFAVIASISAFLIVVSTIPAFARFAARPLETADFFSSTFLFAIPLLLVFVALVAGGYPALRLSRRRSIDILASRPSAMTRRLSVRSILVVLQFVAAMILILSTVVVRGQLRFIRNYNVGYERDQIVAVNVEGSTTFDRLDVIKTEISTLRGVSAVASSSYLPNLIQDKTIFRWPGKADDLRIETYAGFVDDQYIDLYGLDLVSGRNFSKDFPSDNNGAFLINETAVQALGWDDPIGKTLIHWDGREGEIVGVLKDFHYHSLHRPVDPLLLFHEPKNRNYYISVKISGRPFKETLDDVGKVIERFVPEYPFKYRFFDDVFDTAYRSEMRLGQLVTLFAGLAVFIACLGLIGLSTFSAQNRIKEIGIRKTLGSSTRGLSLLLVKDFLKWVVIAEIIAVPIGLWAMQKWLEQFTYRITLGPGIWITTAMIGLILAMTAVLFQTLKAARSHPAKSLRYE